MIARMRNVKLPPEFSMLRKYLKFYKNFFLFSLILKQVKITPISPLLKQKNVNLNLNVVRYFSVILFSKNLLITLSTALSSKSPEGMFFVFFRSLYHDFLIFNSYIQTLIVFSKNFLILCSTLFEYEKFLYYSLFYTYNALKTHKWFFNLDFIFIKQKKWQIFSFFLIKKYKINYIILFDKHILKYKNINFLSSFNVKFLFFNHFAKQLKIDYYVPNFIKLVVQFLLLNYMFYVVTICSFFKKLKYASQYINKYLIPNT